MGLYSLSHIAFFLVNCGWVKSGVTHVVNKTTYRIGDHKVHIIGVRTALVLTSKASGKQRRG
jgi:hypothetical protein